MTYQCNPANGVWGGGVYKTLLLPCEGIETLSYIPLAQVKDIIIKNQKEIQ